MKKVGLFYSYSSSMTKLAAEKIAKEFSASDIEQIDLDHISEEEFLKYDNLILGVPTWFDGELPVYWDELVPAIEDMDFKNKVVAIFGPGDQIRYAENFVDAIGTMADLMELRGAKVVGETPIKGFTYESSQAIRGKNFIGLPLDMANDKKKADASIKPWIQKIKKSFV